MRRVPFITLVIGSFFLGGFLGFLMFTFIEMNKIADQTVVVVERKWLENQLFPNTVKESYQRGQHFLLDAVLKTIEFTFKNKQNHTILGYEFYTESAFQGYAKIRQKEDIIEVLEIYSIYDTDLYNFLIPTTTIDFFYYDNLILVYDGIQNELYGVTSDKNFQKIKKGITQKVWLLDFIREDSKTNSE